MADIYILHVVVLGFFFFPDMIALIGYMEAMEGYEGIRQWMIN